ncbi:MAG: hypothetical protein ACOY4I_04755 [Bacillota bacterium]
MPTLKTLEEQFSLEGGKKPTGNAVETDVLATKTFSNAGGIDKTGTMINNGAVTITPGASNQVIPAGHHNGLGVVNAVTFDASKVLSGTTIAGTAGTMVNRGAVSITPGTVNQQIAQGYHDGGGVVLGDVDLVASNIKSGVNIFGVVGNVQARGYATGTGSFVDNGYGNFKAIVSGLSFTPTMAVIKWYSSNCSSDIGKAYNPHSVYVARASYKGQSNGNVDTSGASPADTFDWNFVSGGFDTLAKPNTAWNCAPSVGTSFSWSAWA